MRSRSFWLLETLSLNKQTNKHNFLYFLYCCEEKITVFFTWPLALQATTAGLAHVVGSLIELVCLWCDVFYSGVLFLKDRVSDSPVWSQTPAPLISPPIFWLPSLCHTPLTCLMVITHSEPLVYFLQENCFIIRIIPLLQYFWASSWLSDVMFSEGGPPCFFLYFWATRRLSDALTKQHKEKQSLSLF